MFRWTTHRGDEWWYADQWGSAAASAGPTSISIDSITTRDDHLTEGRLHELLWTAHQRFGDVAVLCYLNDVTRPVMEQLSSKGLLRWELVQNPHSQSARVLSIEPSPLSASGRDDSHHPPPNDR